VQRESGWFNLPTEADTSSPMPCTSAAHAMAFLLTGGRCGAIFGV
jgi:hypothetical protein